MCRRFLRSEVSSRSFPLKDSLYPFSQGLPGSMNRVPTPILPSQALTALAVNSGPLSERIVIRRSSIREQIGQVMENVVGPKPPGHQDCQALPAVLGQ